MNNRSNHSLLSDDDNDPSEFSLYLSITIGISSLTGTIFSFLSLLRFFRERNFRNHFNYIYHNMLFFSLGNSLIYIPAFYVGVYLSWFIIYPVFCTIFLIHSYSIFAGFGYLLMWTSLERHRSLFRLNINISFSRQMFPLFIVLIFVYTCSTMFVLVPKCSTYHLCEACFIQKFPFVLLFTFYTFVIPVGMMILSTIILLWRFNQHRLRLNKRRQWIRLKRMFYQSIIYLGWYCVAYWPYTIYSLLRSYNSNRFTSINLKNSLFLISIFTIQSLPVLTYFIFKSNQKRTQEKYALSKKSEIMTNKQAPIIERF
jgi:hypothetical protein